MMEGRIYKNRDLYLNKLISFRDLEPVKVVTGIRRCGKSILLKLMARHLADQGVERSQILEMNFESFDFRKMTADDLYHYVRANSPREKRLYLFLDEIQRIPGWEDAVNAFRVDIDCDIYLTGSNAYLLSSEYATYLSGRFVEIKMLPLGFREFLEFHDYSIRNEPSRGVQSSYLAFDRNGHESDMRDLFASYLQFGGMPGIADVGLDLDKAYTLLDGIYSTVVMRDIFERGQRNGRLADAVLLRKIAMFLADNIGNPVSANAIGNTLHSEELMEGKKVHGHTVLNYIDALMESYVFYEIKRFDIKGRDYLRTLGKYYIVDIGLRNYLLGLRNRDIGHILENVVFFELLRRGYDIAIGKIDNQEIDFIATNSRERIYYQVTESMLSETVRERELAPLRKLRDSYPKIVLSMDTSLNTDYDGIRVIPLVDWLLQMDLRSHS